MEYLLRDLPGTLLITRGDRVVFQAKSAPQLTEAFRQRLMSAQRSPVDLPSDQMITTASPQTRATESALFFSPVPGYDLRLLVIEVSNAAQQLRQQLTFTATLITLSVAAFGAATLILRAGCRRLVLETSLLEANKGEQAIAEKKEELELVLEGARMGTWNWNLIDNQVEFSRHYWAMLGYEDGEIPGHLNAWKQLLHPDDAPRSLLPWKPTLPADSPSLPQNTACAIRAVPGAGSTTPARLCNATRRGRPVRAVGIHLDITERKQSQQMLAKAKKESDAIIRDFLAPLILVNTNLTVVRVNQATCDLLGYDEEELIGRKIGGLFHDTPDHVHRIFAFYAEIDQQEAQAREELRNVELCYRLKDGGRMPMSFNVSLLRNEQGIITALVALSPDQQATKSNEAFKRLVSDWAIRLGIDEVECAKRLVERLLQGQNEQDAFTVKLTGGDIHAYFRCNSLYISILEGVASVIALEDITEERKAEEERHLLATVIEQTADSIYVTGTDERVQCANPASIRNSGYSEQELRGQLPLVFRSELMEASTIEDLRRAMAEGRI